MKNRVYGIIGFGEIHANFNADNGNSPRMDNLGRFYASEESVKYAIKNYWVEQNPNSVFGIKRKKELIKTDKDGNISKTVGFKNIEERYEELFGPIPDKKNIDQIQMYKNLLSMNDIINFGTVFAVKDNNIGIKGAVHLDKPINKMFESSVLVESKLTPFVNSKKGEDVAHTTIGRRKMLDEAHKFCDFEVNPNNLNDIKEYGEYKESNYAAFKEGALSGITNLNSTTKKGCYNEFAMFIKMKENTYRNLNKLTSLLDFTFELEEKNVIDLSRVMNRLNKMDEFIEDIEIYFDEETLILEGIKETTGKVKVFDITTRETIDIKKLIK